MFDVVSKGGSMEIMMSMPCTVMAQETDGQKKADRPLPGDREDALLSCLALTKGLIMGALVFCGR